MKAGLRRALALIDAALDPASARRAIALELADREARASAFLRALDKARVECDEMRREGYWFRITNDKNYILAAEILQDYADCYGGLDTDVVELQLFLDTSDTSD